MNLFIISSLIQIPWETIGSVALAQEPYQIGGNLCQYILLYQRRLSIFHQTGARPHVGILLVYIGKAHTGGIVLDNFILMH